MKKTSMRESLKNRQKENIDKKDSGGGKGRGVLDLSSQDDVNFYKPEKGTDKIDILPYIVSTNKHPTEKKGDYDYLLDIYIHFGIGANENTVVCPKKTYGKPCPVCEELVDLYKEDKDEAQKITAKRRCIYNVIDLDNEDKGIQLFDVSHYLFEKELLDELNEVDEDMVICDLEEGKTIKFRAVQETLSGNT